MPKRKPAATDDTEVSKELDLVDVWFPLFEAHVLLAIASELEDNEHYFDRAKALIAASRREVDLALQVIENLLGTGKRKPRTRKPEGE